MTIIHLIKLKISNCFLVESTKKMLVDTGSPGEGKKIIRELRKLGVELSDLSLILHTHGHSDHCGSTAELIRNHKIPTAIHAGDRAMIENGKNGTIKTRGLFAKILKPIVDVPFPAFPADIFLDDCSDLCDFGINGKIHSTTGHTPGSVSLVFDNQEAIIGDLLMGGYIGGTFFPHLPDYHYFIDDLEEVHRSIQKILEFESDKFYVGHGGPLTRASIEKRFISVADNLSKIHHRSFSK
jgi:glyoxylase-like metal-dependent hydrolase (beta-lactamase superfamily II)